MMDISDAETLVGDLVAHAKKSGADAADAVVFQRFGAERGLAPG